LRAFKNPMPERSQPTPGGADRSRPEASWEGNPGNAPGCGRYVPTQARFGKARGSSFSGF